MSKPWCDTEVYSCAGARVLTAGSRCGENKPLTLRVTESAPDGLDVTLKQPFAPGVADTMFPDDGEGWWTASRSRLFRRGD